MKKKIVIILITIIILLEIICPQMILKTIEFLRKPENIETVIIIEILGFALLFWALNYKKLKIYYRVEEDKKLKLIKVNKKIPKMNDVNYYREIPCKGDIIRLYWFLYQYDLINDENNVIGAFILKWAKDGIVNINRDGNTKKIDLSNVRYTDNEVENRLIDILKLAAGSNQILEESELKIWCKKNYRELNVWFKQIIRYQTKIFEKEGFVYDCKAGKVIAEDLNKEIIEILGFKKYLLDYSIIYKKEPIEVEIWEEYLILAQVLGIAKEVVKQFTEIYPEIEEIRKYNFEYISQTTSGRVFRFLILISTLFYGLIITVFFNIGLMILNAIAYIIS